MSYRGTWLSCGGSGGNGSGTKFRRSPSWPPGSLLYPLRYRKKRDPEDNVGSTQPRLDNLLLPPTTFSKTVFLLVPDSVKRKLVSDSPGLVDLDRASEFSS